MPVPELTCVDASLFFSFLFSMLSVLGLPADVLFAPRAVLILI